MDRIIQLRECKLGVLAAALSMGVAMSAAAATVNFDDVTPGALPKGWFAGVTGEGTPKWAVTKDESAPSAPNVLAQTGAGKFPFCVDPGVSLADGFAEVKFKPISGEEDQAGGIVFRFKDKDNYYITRANALEDNVTIYHTVKSVRRAFQNVQRV